MSGGKYAKYGCSKNFNDGVIACPNSVKIKKRDIEESFFSELEKIIPENDFKILNANICENSVMAKEWLFENIEKAVWTPIGDTNNVEITLIKTVK